jgi:hypothetical protein
MQIGVIGLGRMGGNIVRRLTKAGHACVVYDANPAPGVQLAKEGATAAASVPALVEALGPTPRTVWVMLPSGKITEDTIAQLARCRKLDRAPAAAELRLQHVRALAKHQHPPSEGKTAAQRRASTTDIPEEYAGSRVRADSEILCARNGRVGADARRLS